MSPRGATTAGARLLGLLAIGFGALTLFLDLLSIPITLHSGASLATGLPRALPAGHIAELSALLPSLEAALAPIMSTLRALFDLASLALIVVGWALRTGRPWARGAVVAWSGLALALLAARVAGGLFTVAKLRAILGPLVDAPGLPASFAPSTYLASTVMAVVLFSGFPVVLLLLARRRPQPIA